MLELPFTSSKKRIGAPMATYILSFVSGLFGAGLFGFIQFMITRHDNRISEMIDVKKQLLVISRQLKSQEMSQCRTQMLLLISDYPSENAEIMKVAEHYFLPVEKGGLGGDWYMTNLFNRWLTTQKLGKL